MNDILFSEAHTMLMIGLFVMLAVLMAMIVDLGAGLYKAKQRGELRTSEALRRTLSKFISYHGGLIIAVMVDLLIHFLHIFDLLGLTVLSSVPVVTILVGIFLLIVEFMSVREKADAKTKKNQAEAIRLLSQLLSKEDVKELLQMLAAKNNPQPVEDYGQD
ncbi:MAG: phage holin family protein [Bacteroidales bacterium]|nr:phage holin family protein [Bacteroidales bacterium]